MNSRNSKNALFLSATLFNTLVLSGSLAATEKTTQTQEVGVAEETPFLQYQQKQKQLFQQRLTEQQKQFSLYKKIIREEYRSYLKEVAKYWPDQRISSKHEWVFYPNKMQQRAVVDLKNMRIELANASGEKLSTDQRRELINSLLTISYKQAWQQDSLAKNIERRTRQEIPSAVTSELSDEPAMTAAVASFIETTSTSIEALTNQLLSLAQDQKNSGREVVIIEAQANPTLAVTTNNKANSLPPKASPFVTHVRNYAKEFDLPHALVFAIMETESSFNPMARSPIPAYGLMQIVPSSAGIDASKRIYGEGKILAPSYLYHPQNNIQIGTAYLNVLYHRYLRKIENPETRLWCTIAAYNTGSGNVAKAFIGIRNMGKATASINRLSPEQAYQRMLLKLPHEETRNYLPKVRARMAKY